MKQLITTLLLCLITMGAQAKTDLVPTPQSVIWGEGNYTLPPIATRSPHRQHRPHFLSP